MIWGWVFDAKWKLEKQKQASRIIIVANYRFLGVLKYKKIEVNNRQSTPSLLKWPSQRQIITIRQRVLKLPIFIEHFDDTKDIVGL